MKSRIDKTEYSFFIDDYNGKYWCKNGMYHRDRDLPALIFNDGSMYWWNNGELIRDVGNEIEI